ncbi:UVR domain-containing protein [Tanacetum coccineum]
MVGHLIVAIDVVATSSPLQTINRSVSSTRKKKKGGLRIGYGRTPHSGVDIDDSQASSPAISLPVVVVNEEKRENQILLDARITTEMEKRENDVVSVNLDSNVAEFEEEQINLDEVVANSEVQTQEEVALVSVTHKEFIKKKSKVVEELGVVSDKYKEIEKELEEAVETEDFERAERVSDGLASADRDRERLLVVVREVKAECDAVEIKMQEALETQIAAEEECAGLLERFAVLYRILPFDCGTGPPPVYPGPDGGKSSETKANGVAEIPNRWSTASQSWPVADKAFCIVLRVTTLLLRYHYLKFAMSSVNASSTVTYTSVSFDSNGPPSWGIPLMNASEIPEMDPYEELEHPEYHAPSDDDIQVKDHPYVDDASSTAESPGYIADSNSIEEDTDADSIDEDSEEDPKEDPSKERKPEDDNNDDDTNDEDEEPTKDEEEEEQLALADSSVVPVVNPVPSAGDTKAFETDESAPTPRSPQTRVPFFSDTSL